MYEISLPAELGSSKRMTLSEAASKPEVRGSWTPHRERGTHGTPGNQAGHDDGSVRKPGVTSDGCCPANYRTWMRMEVVDNLNGGGRPMRALRENPRLSPRGRPGSEEMSPPVLRHRAAPHHPSLRHPDQLQGRGKKSNPGRKGGKGKRKGIEDPERPPEARRMISRPRRIASSSPKRPGATGSAAEGDRSGWMAVEADVC